MSFSGPINKQVTLRNQDDLISSMNNIFACRGLITEIGLERIYSLYSRQSLENSQIIDQKVFLNETLKGIALFHYETARL